MDWSWQSWIYSEYEAAAFRHVFSLQPGAYWRPDGESLCIYFKAFVSLFGGALLWVGCWDLLSDEARFDGETEHAFFANEQKAHAGYTLGGTVLAILCDTLYANAGMDSPLNPREGILPVWMRWWQRGFEWGSRVSLSAAFQECHRCLAPI